MRKINIIMKMKVEKGAQDRHSSDPEKGTLHRGVVELGGHVWCCLAPSLSNVIRKVDRQTNFQLY